MKRGTIDHPKTLRLMQELRIGRAQAIGHLEALWHFTARYAPQGDVGRWSDADIATACFWDGDPAQFVRGLRAARWVDASDEHRLVVHDFHDHAENTTRKFLKRKSLPFVSEHVRTCQDISSLPLPLPDPVPVPKPLSLGPRKRGSTKTPLPDLFPLTDAMRTFALEGGLDPELQFQKFKDSARANDRRYADWPAAFRYWCRNAAEFQERRQRG